MDRRWMSSNDYHQSFLYQVCLCECPLLVRFTVRPLPSFSLLTLHLSFLKQIVIFDFFVLMMTVVGILKIRGSTRLGAILFSQGVFYFTITAAVNLTICVIVLMQLSPLMSIAGAIPSCAVSGEYTAVQHLNLVVQLPSTLLTSRFPSHSQSSPLPDFTSTWLKLLYLPTEPSNFPSILKRVDSEKRLDLSCLHHHPKDLKP